MKKEITTLSLKSGEKRVLTIGKENVLISRDERLDRYGNPIYRASKIEQDGTFSKSYRSNGGPSYAVEKCLKK